MITKENVRDVLINNTELFNLPITVDSGKDVFPALRERWEKYINLVENTDYLKPCLDIVTSSADYLYLAAEAHQSCNYECANQFIRKSIDLLVSGGNRHFIADFDSLYIDNEKYHWFRAREGTHYPYDKSDMSHIPADKRESVGSNRYSPNGIPCLYLANSIYGCWEELNRVSLDSFWVSRFIPQSETRLRFFNLSITGFEIMFASELLKNASESDDAFHEAALEFFSTFVLQSACSVRVKKEKRSFNEEYIIPQLLMMNLSHYDVDGIMYFSVKMNQGYTSGCAWLSKILAIPALDLHDSLQSAKISSMFKSSFPINIGMYQRGLIVPRRKFIPSQTNWARTQARVPMSSLMEIYSRTIFYKCELELLQDYYYETVKKE